MILNRPLNAEESKRSRHYYFLFNGANGFSYMCLGETVLILFAAKLQCPDHWIACLGGMLYFSFVMLPLGKILTAKYGAVRCQADCWLYRNLAALAVASAAPLTCYVSPRLGLLMLFVGAFFFYGFRAAGCVLARPLLGEIAPAGERGKLIARAWIMFFSSNVLALLLITAAVRRYDSIWILFAIILTGTLVGFCSSFILRYVSETGEIRILAKKRLFPLLPELFRNKIIFRQIIAGMACNLSITLTIPLSMLALKQGYHVSDSVALIYFLIQLSASILASKLLEKYSDLLGGKKMALIGFYCFYGIVLFWLLAPEKFIPWLLIVPFLFCSCGVTAGNTSLELYFLNTVRKDLQVSASIVSSVATGVISGLLGMLLSGGLLKTAILLNHGSSLQGYRIYFLFVLLLLPLLGMFLHQLPKDRP